MFFFSFIHLGNFHVDPQETSWAMLWSAKVVSLAVQRMTKGIRRLLQPLLCLGPLWRLLKPLLCLGPFPSGKMQPGRHGRGWSLNSWEVEFTLRSKKVMIHSSRRSQSLVPRCWSRPRCHRRTQSGETLRWKFLSLGIEIPLSWLSPLQKYSHHALSRVLSIPHFSAR